MAKAYIPARGDIVWLHFDPQVGHERAGLRPAFVASPRAYNRRVGLALFCRLTSHGGATRSRVPYRTADAPNALFFRTN